MSNKEREPEPKRITRNPRMFHKEAQKPGSLTRKRRCSKGELQRERGPQGLVRTAMNPKVL